MKKNFCLIATFLVSSSVSTNFNNICILKECLHMARFRNAVQVQVEARMLLKLSTMTHIAEFRRLYSSNERY
jgi:hypothetical protein